LKFPHFSPSFVFTPSRLLPIRLIVDRFSVAGAIINFARRSKCQSRSKIRMEVRSTCRICHFCRRLYSMYFTLYISSRSYPDLLRCYLLLHRATTGSARHHFCCHNKLHERFQVSIVIVIEDIKRAEVLNLQFSDLSLIFSSHRYHCTIRDVGFSHFYICVSTQIRISIVNFRCSLLGSIKPHKRDFRRL